MRGRCPTLTSVDPELTNEFRRACPSPQLRTCFNAWMEEENGEFDSPRRLLAHRRARGDRTPTGDTPQHTTRPRHDDENQFPSRADATSSSREEISPRGLAPRRPAQASPTADDPPDVASRRRPDEADREEARPHVRDSVDIIVPTSTKFREPRSGELVGI